MKKIIFTLALAASTGLVSFAQDAPKATNPPAPAAAPANPNAPEISFEVTTHDFGTIQKGDDCTYEFKFKNTGKEPLILANCQASCGCTTPACPKEPIGPGSSGSIKVKYDSNRVGVFNKTVTITSNAKNTPITLIIKGKVEGPAQEEAFPGKNNVGMGQ